MFGRGVDPCNAIRKNDEGAKCNIVLSIEESVMFGKSAVDAELSRSLGLTMKEIEPILAAGGDPAEKQFMECCWCLWKADGIELVEPFIETAFNILPAKSRSVLFQRMLTIVYVAQDNELHVKLSEPNEQTLV